MTVRCHSTTYPLFENCEPRRLASVTTWTSNQTTDYSGATYFGSVIFGDNGDPTGYATGSTGMYAEQAAWTYTTWDSDYDDGIDSGMRPFTLGVNYEGSGSVDFVGGSTEGVGFAASAGVQIHQVSILADVAASGYEVDMQNIGVQFFSNGKLVEAVSIPNITDSTIGASTDDAKEVGYRITPSASDGTVTGVVVAGSVRFQAAQGYYPGPTDLSATIAVS